MLLLVITLGASLMAADIPAQSNQTLHIPIEQDQTDVYAIPYDSSEEEEDYLEQDYENMYKQKQEAKK
jgi:hypothetical protein